jgi:serine/threonine protein kinase
MTSSHLALEAVVSEGDRVIARCLLRRGRFVIGQERRNEIVADAASISGRHARLTVASDEHFVLEDLGSANGTYVDGQAIETPTPVTFESQIVLGQASLCFQRGGLPAAVFHHLPAGFLRTSRYAVENVIIEGRTSTIYEARDTVLLRRVAMKVLRRASQANPAQVLAFIRENQIVAQLTHSCILPVYDFGLDAELGLFSATRFVEGESLGTLLASMASGDKKAPVATLSSLLTIFLKVCDAVAFAHDRGVVHGSLDPEAIIFGRFGEVFVDHWGCATIGEPRGEERPRLEVPATTVQPSVSRCMAPEQAGGTGVDPRADVYALGAVLFRIITLRHFNTGESQAQVIARALRPPAAPLEALSTAPPPAYLPGGVIPERLAAMCARALSQNRDERFADAHELKMEIVHWLDYSSDGNRRAEAWTLGGIFGKRP